MNRYLFAATLSGVGTSPERAWSDAVEQFTLDPGLPDPAQTEVEAFDGEDGDTDGHPATADAGTARFDIRIQVDYALNGADPATLRAILEGLPERANDAGLLTGDTEAEATVWDHTVAPPPAKAGGPGAAPDWSREDARASIAQGWSIFSVPERDREDQERVVGGQPYGHRPFELQAVLDPPDDAEPVFGDDAEAWSFVRRQALAGDALAVRAREFLRVHSPVEFERVFGVGPDSTEPLRCPTEARWEGDLVGCGSTDLTGPDDEGMYDCLECGLFFEAWAARGLHEPPGREAGGASPHGRRVKHNHLFGLGFELESFNNGGNVTAEELLAAMERRVRYLRAHPGEILEACGLPDDSYRVVRLPPGGAGTGGRP